MSRTLAVGTLGALAALIALVSFVVSVGGQEGEPDGSVASGGQEADSGVVPSVGGQERHPQGADPGVIDAARTMLASTPVPESQREALGDGVVTYGEYEAAVFSTIACIEAAGLKILEQPHPDPSGKVLEYSFAAGMDLAEAERSNETSRACYKEHQAAIDILWSAQNTPSQEVLAEARKSLDECLREALEGAPISDGQLPDWVRGSEAFLPCIEETQRQYGLPGFGG